ncbi:methylated-DNA--[protein]-cysteine S-methyltransferase [Acidiferrobacter sp.]|uniref:methylated-DNA--[protein]-cysteine S-methyltransferase n=1 Tax=Acidiferrobacter sp. TaxID=1872107 RepID=UPI00263468B0|nr:methylated-DNA--[protein]-cysteine S-methyltransferase [Acidiferrobacter sp.]
MTSVRFFVTIGAPDGMHAWAQDLGLMLSWQARAPGAVRAALTGAADDGKAYRGPVGLVRATAFQRAVWAATRTIPRGETRTYGEVAQAIGSPRAARAAGSALAANPLPLLIPCHRVIGACRRLGSYSDGGPEMKRRLLAREGADVASLR